MLGAVDGVGDFARGGGVDGRAVDEEALLSAGRWRKDGVEEGVKDVFDVGGLREDGDDGFLGGRVNQSGAIEILNDRRWHGCCE